MRIVPVLDVMANQVVRGIAGERHRYRPWRSPLAASSDPLQVARTFRDRFGLAEIYVADLDAIMGGSQNLPLFRALQDDGFRLWVDAGIRTAVDARPLRQAGVARIVAGLETLAGPEALASIVAEDIVFSLDMKAGEPIVSSDWPLSPLAPRLCGGRGDGGEGGTANPRQTQASARDTAPPHSGPLPPQSRGERGKDSATSIDIARFAVGVGISKILVLDLARVGAGLGPGTDELIANLHGDFPRLELTAGGGVRDRDDLARLARLGASSVLIASALHEGRLTRTDIDELAS